MPLFTSLHGRRLGLAGAGNLVGPNEVQITRPCVDATITVGAEVADVRAITVQLKDANGANINYAEMVEFVTLLNAAGTDFAVTGGSTGLAAGASGKALQVVAKKLFKVISTTAGLITVTYTDIGTEAVFLGVRLPNGRLVISSALTNA